MVKENKNIIQFLINQPMISSQYFDEEPLENAEVNGMDYFLTTDEKFVRSVQRYLKKLATHSPPGINKNF